MKENVHSSNKQGTKIFMKTWEYLSEDEMLKALEFLNEELCGWKNIWSDGFNSTLN